MPAQCGVAALAERGLHAASPEASRALAAYATVESVPDAVRQCGSGAELAALGFGADVELAAEVDTSTIVPLLSTGAFQAVAPPPAGSVPAGK